MAKWVVAVFLIVCGCSSASGGDGVLDCTADESPQSAGITATGRAEAEVAKVALKGWAANGARVISFPDADTWSAVQDGDDIAVVTPEKDADGEWVVADVQICGGSTQS